MNGKDIKAPRLSFKCGRRGRSTIKTEMALHNEIGITQDIKKGRKKRPKKG